MGTEEHVMNPRDERRFWRKVRRGPGCWEWTARCNNHGYGKFSINRVGHYAHRVAWEIVNGPIPQGLCVLHHCDNPKCVNPAHLFIGTRADNTRDMMDKGRHRLVVLHGEDHGCHKLTEVEVHEIRQRYARGGISQATLAREYSVTQAQISNIVKRHNWANI